MNVIDTISAVLHNKGNAVWFVAPGATVYEALQVMADKNTGALLVMQDDKLLGMISERDYTRKVILQGKSSKQTLVREIMTSPVITVGPEHRVDDCMRLMTDNRIRHLPVVQGEKVLGVISIGDLVNWIISAQEATIDQLENYITGKYPA